MYAKKVNVYNFFKYILTDSAPAQSGVSDSQNSL